MALVSALAGLANLGVLVALMLVDGQDAVLVAVILLYALGVGAGAALALSRPSAQAVEDAVEAQRRDLIIAVSHDLRTPLAGLRAMVEAVDEGVVVDAVTVRRYAREMRSSVAALSALVDDLFELVQLDVGAIEADGRAATLEQVVDAAVAACGGGANEKGLRVETRIAGAAPTPCSPRLGWVLQNLLQNAIRPRRPTGPSASAPATPGAPCCSLSPTAARAFRRSAWNGSSSRSGAATRRAPARGPDSG